MLTLPVQYTPRALADIRGIVRLLVANGAAIAVAEEYALRIEAKAQRIGLAPSGGTPRPDLGAAVRLVPFERSAVILYRISDAAVEIVRIYYGGRNYADLVDRGVE